MSQQQSHAIKHIIFSVMSYISKWY